MTRPQAIELLRLSELFSQPDLKEAYLNISKGLHADFMDDLNRAYELLKAETPPSPAATPELPEEKKDWKKIYHGDYPFVKMFWFGMLGMIAGFFLLAVLSEIPGAAKGIKGGFIAYFGMCFIYGVGLWRSADKYQGPKGWAVGGKVAGGFIIFSTAVYFLGVPIFLLLVYFNLI